MSETVRVDIVSDPICPWCLIGWERLKRAQAELEGEITTEVHWLPFELNPDMPPEGIERAAYLQAKFGAQRPPFYDRIEGIARQEGIDLEFGKIERTPSTFAAHRLLHAAEAVGSATALKERLLAAYFGEGRNIGDADVLRDCARDAGLSAEVAEAVVGGDAFTTEVRALEDQIRGLGVQGVPFFILDRRLAVSGAQEPDVMVDALRRVVAERREAA